MPTQTLTIIDTLDDGYQDGSNFVTGLCYFGGANPAGLSFLATQAIPAGSTINSAYVRIYRLADQSWASRAARVSVENADPTSNTRFSATHLPGGATFYAGDSTAAVNMIDYQNQYILGSGDPLPVDITARIQSLVTDHGGIGVGERINIKIDAAAGGDYADFQDSEDGTNDPQLFIDWTAVGGGGGNPWYAYAQQ